MVTNKPAGDYRFPDDKFYIQPPLQWPPILRTLGGQGATISCSQSLSGNKPIVICQGKAHECESLEEAQVKAEGLAHQHGCEAFILRPTHKVTPKREAITTEL